MVAIFVVLTILAFVAIDVLATRRQHDAVVAARPRQIRADLPAGHFLHPGHGWVQVDTGGRSQIGVDGFVRGVVGAPDRVLARPVGAWLEQGQPMLTIERDGRRMQVPAPLTGRIEEVNPELAHNPRWWGDAARDGWAYTLRPAHLGGEIDKLRVAEVAAGWMRGQMSRLNAWLIDHAATMGGPAVSLPDGGAPAEGALTALDERAWQAFQRDFLPAGTTWGWHPVDDA